MGLESSISWNIRNFFRVIFFFFFWAWKVLSWIFLNLMLEIKFHFLKHKKTQKNKKRENLRTFLILGSKSFISWNIRIFFFFWKNVKRFFRADFLFFELGLKSASGDLIFCYYWNGKKSPFLDILAFSSACFGLKMKYYHLKFSL